MKASNNNLFTTGIDIIKQIKEHGFQAYFVGGCVRDYVLSLPIKDIDITTSATTDELHDIFPQLIPIGIDHGTVLIRQNNASFEITTYRGEQTQSLQDDLNYRDFTMNAIAMDIDMRLIDYHNGIKDIQLGIIRSVGSAVERIHEDPLRIMRAIRFMSQFGFTIEDHTKNVMQKSAYLLESVAVERLHAECEGVFAHAHCKKAVNELVHLQIDSFLPMFSKETNLLATISARIQPLHSFSEVIAVMHMHAPHHAISTWCNAWKCSNKQKTHAKKMVKACRKANEKGLLNLFLMYTLHEDVDSFYRIYSVIEQEKKIPINKLHAIQEELPIHTRDELAINGKDLIQLFPDRKPGKWIEGVLSTVEYKVVMQELSNNSKTLKEWITCNPPETN